MKKLILTHNPQLDLAALSDIYNHAVPIQLAQSAKNAIKNSYATLKNNTAAGNKVYGVNTGFGKLANVTISASQSSQLQHNAILSHACGVGPALPENIVRLIMALKIQSFAQGFSGVQLAVVEQLLKFYNQDTYPIIPSQGSVGASGDLAPLAHMSLPLIGEGQVCYQGKRITGKQSLKKLRLTPLTLKLKDGLALLNGTQVSTAIAIGALLQLQYIYHAAIIAGSLSVIASGDRITSFDKRIQEIRHHQGQIEIAKVYYDILNRSQYKINADRTQSPYSLRCQPQVMGACLQQIRFAAECLINEANAVTDNPLVFSKDNVILTGGNFHAETIAMAADNLALAIAEVGNLSERRIAFLMDEHMSGLPAFLSLQPGLNSGFMLAHVTAASLVTENKTLAHPVSVDSIPTSANQEDHVSMATYAARRLHAMVENAETIIAIELLAACQGIDLVQPKKLALPLQKAYQAIRKQVKFLRQDRSLANDINKIKKMIATGNFSLGKRCNLYKTDEKGC